ncbi:hypothetical protein GKO46_13130 [SAR202 cluster bacterium JH702]|uniref:DNA primase/polymerase bifunctional N-terminal domain-containing protein n=1 Tax=Candidatus Lucifugimonas marina TaxID=3038979 RepID=A0ABD4XV45_9CHLR|nr:hypothetical protein [SAR202 cluster bacterium JH702]
MVANAVVITNPAFETALLAASAGRAVLPCCGIREYGSTTCKKGVECESPGKHPLIKGAGKNATTNIEDIRKWGKRFPDANWAWVPGRSGLAVVDQDNRNGGDDDLESLEHTHGALPETEHVITGDGYHYTLCLPQGIQLSAQNITQGLELKTGSAAYVMLAGSRHHTGRRYEFEVGYELGEIEVAPMPDWMLELATRKSSSTPKAVSASGIDFTATRLDGSRLDGLREPGTHLWKLWHRDASIHGDQSPSGWDYKLFSELARLGYELEDAHPVLVEHRRLYGDDETKLFDPRYVDRTWTKATASTTTEPRSPVLNYERTTGIERAFWLSEKVFEMGGNITHVYALEVLASYSLNGVCHMAGGRMAQHLGGQTDRHGRRTLLWLSEHGFIQALSEPKRGKAKVWNLLFLSNEWRT